ncbi:MAG: putative membrane protein [Saprospiraceae bacterium]|jgi:putative membrane protein
MVELLSSPLMLKSLHLIFVVTWFAGLFYIVRLFIYHVEAQEKTEPAKSILSEQYKIMEKRLWYIISWPSMILTIIIASSLLYSKGIGYMMQDYMLLKLGFVALLVFYHLGCHKIYKQLQNTIFKYSSMQLRLWNEVATLLLFAIIFLIVYKSLDFYKGLAGFVLLAILLMLGIKLYKKSRNKSE